MTASENNKATNDNRLIEEFALAIWNSLPYDTNGGYATCFSHAEAIDALRLALTKSHITLVREPVPARKEASTTDEGIKAVIAPVLDWYQPDDQHPRPLADILRDIVTDLQADRAENLKMAAALRRLHKAGNADPHVARWMREIIDAARSPDRRCRCGRALVNPRDADPWCAGCNQSAAACDCTPVAP